MQSEVSLPCLGRPTTLSLLRGDVRIPPPPAPKLENQYLSAARNYFFNKFVIILYIILFIILSGVRLSSLGTAATTDLLYQPQNLRRRGGKPATNRPSYGAAYYPLYLKPVCPFANWGHAMRFTLLGCVTAGKIPVHRPLGYG
jgi:hypothetical protein